MARKDGPGDFTVEVSPKRPKTTVVVSDTKKQVVEVSERGVAGPVGPTGPRGTGLLYGVGMPPDSLGSDDDFYFDTVTGYYYGPKAGGHWPTTPIILSPPTKRYIHTQAVAASTWSITHPLGGRPSVTIVDSAGTTVVGEVVYNSDTSVTVLFTSPFSGQAYLT